MCCNDAIKLGHWSQIHRDRSKIEGTRGGVELVFNECRSGLGNKKVVEIVGRAA